MVLVMPVHAGTRHRLVSLAMMWQLLLISSKFWLHKVAAVSLIECISLVWHRFFLPQIPTLVSIRNRLTLGECASTSSATKLLFALLCLLAYESSDSASRPDPQLKQSIQLAVSAYGQAFIFSPPTDRDSIAVSLLLSHYKPVALVSSQFISHSAIKSSLYVNLAYRVAERLNLLPEQLNLNLSKLNAADSLRLERCLVDSFQGLQIQCDDAFLDGFLGKPVQEMRHMVSKIKPNIETYRSVLKGRRCSPRITHHILHMTGSCILMEALADIHQNWNSLEGISMVLEEVEKRCEQEVESGCSFLEDVTDREERDDLSAVCFLLRMRFQSVYVFICGIGLPYGTILRARLKMGSDGGNAEIDCHEAVQIGSQVIDNFKNAPNERTLSFSAFLQRFGVRYPSQLEAVLRCFIDGADSLRLNGTAFRPPPRHFVFDIVFNCKALLENNVVRLKNFGQLHPGFGDQLNLSTSRAQRLEAMAASPWDSIDAAFASGCVYAAGSKLIYGLRDLMENLKTRTLKGEEGQKQLAVLEMPDFKFFNEADLDFSSE